MARMGSSFPKFMFVLCDTCAAGVRA